MSIRLACLAALLAPLSAPLLAQENLAQPQLSPPMALSHTLGITKIDLDYGAPSVRDRVIFGDKLPYGVVWRAGANATTKISFSHDVMVEGELLAAGSYGLHMQPGPDAWEIIFNNQNEAWGSYSYDPATDALRVTVEPRAAPQREQLRYAFEDVSDDSASLVLHWEKTEVPVHIAVDVTELVLGPVRAAAQADGDGPGWQFWAQAADFGQAHGVSAEETMDWVERSIAAKRTFTNLWMRFEWLAAAGRKQEAEESRAQAMEKVTLDQLQSLAYRYHQRHDFDNAAKIFGMVVAQDSSNWWPYTMLAQARRELGDLPGAAEALRGALSANPDPVTRAEIEAHLAKLESEG